MERNKGIRVQVVGPAYLRGPETPTDQPSFKPNTPYREITDQLRSVSLGAESYKEWKIRLDIILGSGC